MKKINENAKVTLTIGQIRQLIKESKNVGDCEWFRMDVKRSVSEEFRANIYDLRCYYDGHDDYITKRDFVIEGRFGRNENGHYPEEKNRLYAAIRKAGGTNIIGRVFRNGGFDVAFDISPKKLAQYRQKEAEFKAKEDQEKARKDLLKYCELDTYAMVKVLEKLYEVVE